MPNRLRIYLLSKAGVKFGKNCFVGAGVEFDGLRPDLIEIGDESLITSGCKILTHFINPDDRDFYLGSVKIGSNVFIGVNALIVNSVTIGDNAMIGAGSVVTKDIPANQIWAGVPAKFIKETNPIKTSRSELQQS